MTNPGVSRFRAVAGSVLVAIGLAAAPSVAATVPNDAVGAQGAARERDAGKLQDLADASGALGIYLDTAAGDYVVVVPSSEESSFRVTSASALSLSVRVERRDIDRATIDAISAALEARHSSIKASFGFGFDPESGTVVLVSEAPKSEFAAVLDQFPGKITFRSGWFESTASRCADTAPYSGGACLDGSLLCTSGFALDFNAGGRYMVTAGHCNPNGTTTNMGTAWREVEAYPYWDFELIRGKTYRPYLYDSGSYTRPVVNSGNPSVGSSYCTSGRTSGTKCGLTVRKINQTICYASGYPSGACAHNLAEFYNAAEWIVQPGDSGGPLFFSYSSPLRAGIRGVISGRSWDLVQGWSSYATQYQSIASYYVAHAALAN